MSTRSAAGQAVGPAAAFWAGLAWAARLEADADAAGDGVGEADADGDGAADGVGAGDEVDEAGDVGVALVLL
ncbi:MAG TPA: hypothetical protein VG268_07720 [Streptosporangiaceae bacterium]|nr:hypothetical protein [Streptosporangiaceae bacterium]